MERERLKQFIKNTIPVSLPVLEQIVAAFNDIHISKGDFFLKAGRPSDNYLFLETGFLRAYTFDQNGDEVTTAFYVPDNVVFEVYSFFNRTISTENIEALADCKGYVLTYDQLNDLFHTVHEFRDFGRAMLVRGFVALKQRMLSLINETAEQRYAQLIQTKPMIFQYAPLKDIASYLGITDTSLSRIRKNFVQK